MMASHRLTAPRREHPAPETTPTRDQRAHVTPSTYGLALATVAVGVSGHSVAGLMPSMSAHLRAEPSVIGQLVTIFAVTCALAGPLLAAATGRWERRRLLVTALLVTAAGNGVAAAATAYPLLAVGRAITALGAATATAVAVGTTAASNPVRCRARAMSVVLAGLTIALLVGVPGTSAAAGWWGYQPVLGAMAALCVVAAVVVATATLSVPAPPPVGLRERLAAAGQRRVLAILGSALLCWISCFVVYPYLAALMQHYAGERGAALLVLLVGYGVGAVTGNTLGGIAADRLGPRATLLIAAAGSTVVLLMVIPAVGNPIASVAALAGWGLTTWSANPAINAWLIRLNPQQSSLLLALASSAIYMGMGMGGLISGAVIAWAEVPALIPVAAAVSVLTFALLAAAGPAVPPWRENLMPSTRPPAADVAALRSLR